MTTIDPERQGQAKQYARINRRLWLVTNTLSTVYTLTWLFSDWAIGLRDWLTTISPNPWFIVAGFITIFAGAYSLVSLPLTYYSGFFLPHHFDQSTQSLKDWINDQLKGLAIGVPLGLLLIELLYLALRVTGDLWWLWAAGGMLAFIVLLSNLAPILIMPLFNKYVPLDDEHADLADRLLKLAKKANTKVHGVFKYDMSRQTKSANAALTGIGNTRRIILGDTLIDEFSADEIETILAHELGHHVHKDIPILIAFGTFTITLGLYFASLALNIAIGIFGFSSPADVAALPALGLILGVYGLVIMPLDNAVSRWRENLADDYALEITGKKDAFASAFKRLANQNLGEVDPERWVVFFFYSHPPLGERIAKAENWK